MAATVRALPRNMVERRRNSDYAAISHLRDRHEHPSG
jgi:hypothetical protein